MRGQLAPNAHLDDSARKVRKCSGLNMTVRDIVSLVSRGLSELPADPDMALSCDEVEEFMSSLYARLHQECELERIENDLLRDTGTVVEVAGNDERPYHMRN